VQRLVNPLIVVTPTAVGFVFFVSVTVSVRRIRCRVGRERKPYRSRLKGSLGMIRSRCHASSFVRPHRTRFEIARYQPNNRLRKSIPRPVRPSDHTRIRITAVILLSAVAVFHCPRDDRTIIGVRLVESAETLSGKIRRFLRGGWG